MTAAGTPASVRAGIDLVAGGIRRSARMPQCRHTSAGVGVFDGRKESCVEGRQRYHSDGDVDSNCGERVCGVSGWSWYILGAVPAVESA